MQDLHIPEKCDIFAKRTDHLLLEYSVNFQGHPYIAKVNPPDTLFHFHLDKTHDSLLIKGLCLHGTRLITWPNSKGLSLVPFVAFDVDEPTVEKIPIVLNVTLHHVTEARDFEIFEAFKVRNVSRVLSLIDEHVGINAVDESGFTMLMLSAQSGYLPIVAALLNTRRPTVDINIAKANGFTALYYSVALKSEGVLLALLRRGADPNMALLQEGSEGNTPLHLACALEKPLHAKLLLEYGANRTALNANRLRPLDMLPQDAVYSTKLQFKRLFEVLMLLLHDFVSC